MFFKKSTLALAFVALASFVSAEQTPACLLSVIGDTSDPADLSSLCGSQSKKIQSEISDACGDKSDKALKFYASTCKANGHTVELSKSDSTTSSSSSTATSSGFVTTTSSGSEATSTSSSSDSASASGSGSGSGTNTASAASSTYTGAAAPSVQLSVTAIGAAVFMGAAALL